MIAEHAGHRRLWRRALDAWRPREPVLNLACGSDRPHGWVNVDVGEWDLHRFPWPWPDASFRSIVLDQYLEHVPQRLDGSDGLVRTMREVARILAPGGRVLVGVPYWRHRNQRIHPEHYRAFEEQSFDWLPLGGPGVPQVPLRVVWVGKERRLQAFGLDTAYHGPKWLGSDPNIGVVAGLLFVMERLPER